MLKALANDIRDLPEAWFMIAVTWTLIAYMMDGEFSAVGAGIGLFWSYCVRRCSLEARGRKTPMRVGARRRRR